MRWLLCTLMIFGNWIHCFQANLLLIVIESILLKWALMVRLIALRQILLLRAINELMAKMKMTHFLLWPKCFLSNYFFLLLLCATSHYISWISWMLFFMVSSMRKFIWSKHMALLLRGSLVWFANFITLYMA